MSDLTERKLGWGFGLLGGVLLVAAAIVGALIGTFDLVTGRLNGALNAGTEAVLYRFRKLLVRYEKYQRTYEALIHLASAIICWRKVGIIYG